MFFYTLSTGTYHEWEPVIVYRHDKMSRVDFFSLCQDLVREGKAEIEDMVETLCFEHGFSKVESLLEVNSGVYEDFTKITEYGINEDTEYFGLEYRR